jgi:hypothetical protein
MLAKFCTWLNDTALAHTLQTSVWLIPALQTVHILSVAILISAIFLLSLRILGLAGTSQTQAQFTRRLAPAIWAPLPVLLLTGLLQITAEPERSLFNHTFWLKMKLIVAGITVFGLYWRQVRKTLPSISPAPRTVRIGQYLFAVTLLGLWGAIVFAGRLIAYTQ